MSVPRPKGSPAGLAPARGMTISLDPSRKIPQLVDDAYSRLLARATPMSGGYCGPGWVMDEMLEAMKAYCDRDA